MESTTVKVIAAGGLTGDAVNQLTNELSKYKFKIMLKYQAQPRLPIVHLA
ncbi:hypothetical protein [Secundilactobacillus odoratitofui]|nr:hypothetical protein [Secundilactobacillus odoratitofui]